MTKEEIVNKIISTIKQSINEFSRVCTEYDYIHNTNYDVIYTNSDDVGHIAEQIADELYNFFNSIDKEPAGALGVCACEADTPPVETSTLVQSPTGQQIKQSMRLTQEYTRFCRQCENCDNCPIDVPGVNCKFLFVVEKCHSTGVSHEREQNIRDAIQNDHRIIDNDCYKVEYKYNEYKGFYDYEICLPRYETLIFDSEEKAHAYLSTVGDNLYRKKS